MEFYVGSIIGLIIVAVVVIATVLNADDRLKKVEEKINAYNTISIGDTKESVIEKLGTGFTRSVLKDGTEKLVWVLQKGSSAYVGYSHNGVHAGGSTYTGVKKCTVKFQDNKVVEVSGTNLELEPQRED